MGEHVTPTIKVIAEQTGIIEKKKPPTFYERHNKNVLFAFSVFFTMCVYKLLKRKIISNTQFLCGQKETGKIASSAGTINFITANIMGFVLVLVTWEALKMIYNYVYYEEPNLKPKTWGDSLQPKAKKTWLSQKWDDYKQTIYYVVNYAIWFVCGLIISKWIVIKSGEKFKGENLIIFEQNEGAISSALAKSQALP